MIMDNERSVRISNFEICEIAAVLGCDRLCCSDGGFVIHCFAPMTLTAQQS